MSKPLHTATALGLLVALAAAPQARARENLPEVKAKIYAATKDLLAKVAHDDLNWGPGMSMAIPAVWPPDGSGKVIFYLCAYGADPKDRTKNFVSTIYAKITMDVREKEPLKIEQVASKIERVGVVGLPLVSPDVWTQIDKAQSRLLDLMTEKSAKLQDVEEIKEPLCQWAALNAPFGAQLATRHVAYFRWLHCPAANPPPPSPLFPASPAPTSTTTLAPTPVSTASAAPAPTPPATSAPAPALTAPQAPGTAQPSTAPIGSAAPANPSDLSPAPDGGAVTTPPTAQESSPSGR